MKTLARPLTAFCALAAALFVAVPLQAQSNVLANGIWVDRAGLLSLPTSGAAWDNVSNAAKQTCSQPDLTNQDDPANVCVLAKALVFARTGQASLRLNVVDALWAVINAPSYNGRALALGRELGAYVISADLIDLKNYDPAMDLTFRSVIRALLTTPTTEAGTLIQCNENRPNNWGLHCGGSRAAVAAYLGDTAQLARVAQVFKGWLGDRSSYAGFAYGDLSWQCDSTKPVGINPLGCQKSGYSVDGVLPDDQRRAGGFTWPPPQENYVYEALQGALLQAVILNRAGYDTFNWQDRALQRAFQWLLNQANFPATGDDSWEPHLINYYYASIGYKISAPVPTSPGKNVGWTDWSHQAGTPAPTPSLSLSPQTLSFAATVGDATPASQPVRVANVGGGTMNWTASSSDPRWTVTPASGSNDGTVNVAPSTTGMAAGTYSATITVASSGANGSPSTVTASVVVGAAPNVSALALSPSSVTGGAGSTGTVTISAAAPTGGAVVTLQSNNAAASVPASVTVPSGAVTASFVATTTTVTSTQSAVITATFNGSAQATLTVNAAAPNASVSAVVLSPNQVTGGAGSTGTVTLSSAAGSGGAVVALQSNNAAVTVPASVTVAAGGVTGSFSATTTTVSSTQTATITATYNGSAQSTLTVNAAPPPPPVAGAVIVALSPTQVTAGGSSTGTVTIDTPAPTGKGITVTLQSNNAAVSVPASVTVAHNKVTVTFVATTTSVSSTQTATITATLNGTAQATLTVLPAVTTPPQASTLPANADVYVRDGTTAAQNFGTAPTMDVKDGDPTFIRRGLIRFNLSGVNSINTATLKMYVVELPNGAPAPVCAYAVAADSWTESGVTWNNQPAMGAPLGCQNVGATGWMSIDVSAQAKQELAGDKQLSIAIANMTHANLMLRFNTRENGSNTPGLEIK